MSQHVVGKTKNLRWRTAQLATKMFCLISLKKWSVTTGEFISKYRYFRWYVWSFKTGGSLQQWSLIKPVHTRKFFQHKFRNIGRFQGLNVHFGQTYPYAYYMYIHPQRSPFLSVSLYDVAFSSYGPILGKVHWVTKKVFDMFKIKSTHMQTTYTYADQNVSSVLFYDKRFLSYDQFWETYTEWRKSQTLTCSRSKGLHMDNLHPQSPQFRPFRSIVSLFRPKFVKSAPNHPKMTLKCSSSRVSICILHTHTRHTLSSVALYDEPFLHYGPILWKVHHMTPRWPWHFQLKN